MVLGSSKYYMSWSQIFIQKASSELLGKSRDTQGCAVEEVWVSTLENMQQKNTLRGESWAEALFTPQPWQTHWPHKANF